MYCWLGKEGELCDLPDSGVPLARVIAMQKAIKKLRIAFIFFLIAVKMIVTQTINQLAS